MVPKTCRVPECGRSFHARDLCKVHYYRVQRTGQTGPAGRIPRKADSPCSVANCVRPQGEKGGRGYCSKHYQMFRKTGDPCGSTAPTAAERFWPRVHKTESCWLWSGSKDGNGYGTLSVNGRQKKTHRLAYEILVGPIPSGLVLDHLCRTPACVNPEHLEPVTNQENLERGWGRRVKNGWVDHCINGHKFTPDNTYTNTKGALVCRVCSAASRRRYEHRQKRTAA